MKLSLKSQHHLFWSAIGFGAMSVISAIILLQLASMRGHYPVQYGPDPSNQNLVMSDICYNQTNNK